MDANELIEMINTEKAPLTSFWGSRNQKLQTNKDVINLVKPITKTDEIRWLSNEPKVFFNTSRALISLYPPRFRLPLSMNFKPEEKERMNKAERLCIGIHRALDQREIDQGGVNWLWDLAYWVLLGWYAVFNIVVESKEGVKFIADIWDPATVYPKWDADGLAVCIRTYSTNKLTALSMAGEFMKAGLEFDFTEPVQEQIEIVNYWQRTFKGGDAVVQNAITIAGQVIKPLTVQPHLDHIPIHVGAIGSPDRMALNAAELRGESIIDGNKDEYDHWNSIISLMATILDATAYPNIVTKTRSGNVPFKQENFQGHSSVVPLRLEDQIEIMKHAATPQEASQLLAMIGQQIQKGALPSSVYGAVPVEISGFALSQLMAAVKYRLGPYQMALQTILARVCSDSLYQYRKGKYGKMTLSTTNPYDLKRGLTYMEEFSAKDVPERIFVEVTLPISSQFDKTQAILNARQALQPPQLLSRETLWETELDIQDTEQEYERIRQDQVMEDPFIRQVEIIERMWQRVEAYRVKGNIPAAEALKRYVMGLEMQLGMRKSVLVTPGENPPRPSPNAAPPEMTMSPNPDQMRAMTGTPPPSLNRPTRPENQGRVGALVSPSGQPLI